MPLTVIACSFRRHEYDDTQYGIAICSDPDTPITFIFADGKPYKGEEIWNYKLQHHMPWAEIGFD